MLFKKVLTHLDLSFELASPSDGGVVFLHLRSSQFAFLLDAERQFSSVFHHTAFLEQWYFWQFYGDSPTDSILILDHNCHLKLLPQADRNWIIVFVSRSLVLKVDRDSYQLFPKANFIRLRFKKYYILPMRLKRGRRIFADGAGLSWSTCGI
jgi:hypothetical protein